MPEALDERTTIPRGFARFPGPKGMEPPITLATVFGCRNF